MAALYTAHIRVLGARPADRAGYSGVYVSQRDALGAAWWFARRHGRRHVVYRCREHWEHHCWLVEPASAASGWLRRRALDRMRTGRDWATRY
jgi:hypothetical protein